MKKLIVIFSLSLLVILGIFYSNNINNTVQLGEKDKSTYSSVTVSLLRTFDVNNFDEMFENSDLIVISRKQNM